MAIVTGKLEILVDLNKPAEEIEACIIAIINAHPGRQLEILRQVDLWMGEIISKIEEQQAKVNTENKDSPAKGT